MSTKEVQHITGQDKQSGEAQHQRIDNTVARTKGRKVRWQYPQWTDEQNFQLGMQNIRGLFLEKYPEFSEEFTFTQDGVIAETDRERATERIVTRIGSFRQFRDLVPASGRADAPEYLKSDHSVLITHAFAAWEVQISEEQIRPLKINEHGMYVDENGDMWEPPKELARAFGVTSVNIFNYFDGVQKRDGLGRNGEFVPLYSYTGVEVQVQQKRGQVEASQETRTFVDGDNAEWAPMLYFQEKYGVDLSTLKARLPKDAPYITGFSAGRQKTKLYRADVIDASMQEFLNLPVVTREDDIYTNEHNEEFITARRLSEQYGIPGESVRYYLASLPQIRGRMKNRGGQQAILFPRHDAEELLSALVQVPKLPSATEPYIGTDSVSWDSLNSFASRHGGTDALIMRRMKGREFEVIDGRDATGQKTKLYKTSDIEALMNDFLALPKVDNNSNRVTQEVDGEQFSYISVAVLYNKYHIAYSAIQRLLKEAGVNSIQGREATGRETTFYDEASAEEIISAFLALPKVPETGVIELSGKKFAYREAIIRMYPGITRNIIESLTEEYDIAYTEGRDKMNRSTKLYDIDQLHDHLLAFLARPQVDKATGMWTDEEGNQWISLYTAEQKYGLTRTVFFNRNPHLAHIEGRSTIGTRVQLYREEDLKQIVQQIERGKVNSGETFVSPDEADELLEELLNPE